jgi:hypothetical protein
MDKLPIACAILAIACSAGHQNGDAPGGGDSVEPAEPAVEDGPDDAVKTGEAGPAAEGAEPAAGQEPPATAQADAGPGVVPEEPSKPPPEPRVIRFAWKPRRGPAEAYEMPDPEDQHYLVLMPGVEEGGSYPVVVAFHGQPKRGQAPRTFRLPGDTANQLAQMIRDGELRPVILIAPVFRFIGGNWPWFDLREFREHMEGMLAEQGLTTTEWYAFGHSGAAGCKGDGLNRAHRMRPTAVGYFDTCIGQGWADEIERLRQRGVRVLNVHSVETAGFVPKQTPEYQTNFDFGRAYGPAGMKPVECPEKHPGEKLRPQKYRCASSKDGLLRAFVVDSGAGKEGHRNVLVPAIHYFLTEFCGLTPE